MESPKIVDYQILNGFMDSFDSFVSVEDYLKHHENIETTKVINLLTLVGDNKNYQRLTITFLSLICMVIAFVPNQLPFIYKEPVFRCYNKDRSYFNCPESQACRNPHGFYVFEPLSNLKSEFELYCADNTLETYKIATTSTSSVIAFVLIFISGFTGRLSVIYGLVILFIIGSLISFIAPTLWFMFTGLGLSQISYIGLLPLSAIYMTETNGIVIRDRFKRICNMLCVYFLFDRKHDGYCRGNGNYTL